MQDGQFMTSADARSTLPGGEKPSVVLVSRPSVVEAARKITYEVVDQPPSKSSSRWERVAAVICQGKRWQFKEYPFKVKTSVLSLICNNSFLDVAALFFLCYRVLTAATWWSCFLAFVDSTFISVMRQFPTQSSHGMSHHWL